MIYWKQLLNRRLTVVSIRSKQILWPEAVWFRITVPQMKAHQLAAIILHTCTEHNNPTFSRHFPSFVHSSEKNVSKLPLVLAKKRLKIHTAVEEMIKKKNCLTYLSVFWRNCDLTFDWNFVRLFTGLFRSD